MLLRLNRSDEAQAVYERALTFESDNADLYYNLGVVFIEQGKPQQALAHFHQALQIEPDHFQVRGADGMCLGLDYNPAFRMCEYNVAMVINGGTGTIIKRICFLQLSVENIPHF